MSALGKRITDVSKNQSPVPSLKSSQRRKMGPSPLQSNSAAMSLENMAHIAENLEEKKEFGDDPLFLEDLDHDKTVAAINKSLFSDGFVQYSLLAEEFADQHESAFLFETPGEPVLPNILENIKVEEKPSKKVKNPEPSISHKSKPIEEEKENGIKESASGIKTPAKSSSKSAKNSEKTKIHPEKEEVTKKSEEAKYELHGFDQKSNSDRNKSISHVTRSKNVVPKGNSKQPPEILEPKTPTPKSKTAKSKTPTKDIPNPKPTPKVNKPENNPASTKQSEKKVTFEDQTKKPITRKQNHQEEKNLIIPKPAELVNYKKVGKKSEKKSPSAAPQKEIQVSRREEERSRRSKGSVPRAKIDEEDDFIPEDLRNLKKNAYQMHPLFSQVEEDQKKIRSKSQSVPKKTQGLLPERFKDVTFPQFLEDYGSFSKKKGRKTQADKVIENRMQESNIIGFTAGDFDSMEDYEILANIKKKRHEFIKEQYNKGAYHFETRINTLLTSLVYKLQPLDGRHLCYCDKAGCPKAFTSAKEKSLHVLSDLGMPSKTCEICLRTFFNLQAFSTHMCL